MPSRRRPLRLRPPSLPSRPPALPKRSPPPLIPLDCARPQSRPRPPAWPHPRSPPRSGRAPPTSPPPRPCRPPRRCASHRHHPSSRHPGPPPRPAPTPPTSTGMASLTVASPIRSSPVDIPTAVPLLASPPWRLASTPPAADASGSSSPASAHSGTSSRPPTPRALLVSRSEEYRLLFRLPPDEVHLIDGRGASSNLDSARQNLAATFVNAFVNAGFGQDKLMTAPSDSSSRGSSRI